MEKSQRIKEKKWVLLFQIDKGCQVYIYEPLRKKEISLKVKKGWQII